MKIYLDDKRPVTARLGVRIGGKVLTIFNVGASRAYLRTSDAGGAPMIFRQVCWRPQLELMFRVFLGDSARQACAGSYQICSVSALPKTSEK